MKLFLKQIIRFSIFILLVSLGVHFTLDLFLNSSKRCDSTWSTIFNGHLETDIVILGNSRAEQHYNPNVISNITGLRSYNLGIGGTPLNILNIRWSSYINRNKKPKILILDVDYNVLGTASRIYSKFQYLPYVGEKEYFNVAKNIEEPLFLDTYLPLYKYKGQGTKIFGYLKDEVLNNCKTIVNGYKPNTNLWNESEWKHFKTNRLNEIVDYKTFNALYKKGIGELNIILEYCKSNDILVFMIWSPQYYEVHDFKNNQRKYVDSVLKVISRHHKVDYFNFSNDTLVYDKLNFYDHSHLNYKGSESFSKKVSALINRKIKRSLKCI